MSRATKNLSSTALADKLDELQTSLVATGSAGEVTFMIQSKRENLKAAIDVLRQVLREPALSTTELDLLKQKRVADIEEQLKEPQALAPRFVSQKLNAYPAGDVRHVPNLPDELKAVKGLEVAAVQKVYHDFLSAQAGELVVIGDFDEKEMKLAMETALAGWKSKIPFERISRKAEPRINTPDKANAMYFAGLVIEMKDDHPDYAALVVGNEILGGSGFASRLMSRIREKEGLSYGVASIFRSSAFDARSTFSIYAICNPKNAEKVLVLAKEEMDLILKNGITQSELSDAQEGLVQGQEADRSEDGKLASILANSLFAGRTMKYQAQLDEKIRALKCEDVQAALKRHLVPEKFVNVLAGDFKP
jgi:zinc protease